MAATETIKVVTFNIQHGALGDYGRGHPELVADACEEFQADIIGLQEVDRRVPRSQYADLAKLAAERCGMDHRFAKARTFRGRGEFGNALLAAVINNDQNIPIKGDYHTIKPFGHQIKLVPEPRNVLIAGVVVQGREVTVGVTHAGGDNRAQMLGRAAALLAARHGPVILLTDSNLNWAETQACVEPYGLNAIQDELRSPDHIIIRGLRARSIGKHFLDSGLSDHHPVAAELEFTE